VHDKFKRRSELSDEQWQGTPATPATSTEGLLSYTRGSTLECHIDNCKATGGSDSDENATFEPDADLQRRLERRQQLQAFGGVWKNVMGARYKRAHARVKWVVSVDKDGFHLRSHAGEVRSSLPTQFACFTSTKVQILTALVTAQGSRCSFAHRVPTQFTCFTSTKVQILTAQQVLLCSPRAVAQGPIFIGPCGGGKCGCCQNKGGRSSQPRGSSKDERLVCGLQARGKSKSCSKFPETLHQASD
jgi:hypothetical protein